MLLLDGDEPLDVLALPEHLDKPPRVILGDVDGEELAGPKARPYERRNQGMLPQPLIGPTLLPHVQCLRGIEQAELVGAAQALPLRLLFLGAFIPSVGHPKGGRNRISRRLSSAAATRLSITSECPS
jgi:hypothetical protein